MQKSENKNFWKNLNRKYEWLKIVIFLAVFVAAGASVIFVYNTKTLKSKSENQVAEEVLRKKAEKNKKEEKNEREKEGQENTAIEQKKTEKSEENSKEIEKEEESVRKAEEEKRESERKEKIEAENEQEYRRDAAKRQENEKKVVALTFDDGPSRFTTPRLLDVLKEKRVKVTFFVLGVMAQNGRDIVRREVEEGHEVQSHTMYHGDFRKMSAEQIRDDMNRYDNLMNGITGGKPTLVRPPYGVVTQLAREVINRPFICWDVDTMDWKHRNAETVRARTISGIHNGAVVLMHDIHATTVDAVPAIIDELRGMGYEFVTVSELARIYGVEFKPKYEYWGVK